MRGVSSSDSGGGPVRVGAKRKRVASGNENQDSLKTTRSVSRNYPKRRKPSEDSSSEEDELEQEDPEAASSMDVDEHDGEEDEHGSDRDENENDETSCQSFFPFFLYSLEYEHVTSHSRRLSHQ